MAAINLRARYVTLVNDYQTVEILHQDPKDKDLWIVRDEHGREYARRYSDLSPTLVKTRPSSRSGTYHRAR